MKMEKSYQSPEVELTGLRQAETLCTSTINTESYNPVEFSWDD